PGPVGPPPPAPSPAGPRHGAGSLGPPPALNAHAPFVPSNPSASPTRRSLVAVAALVAVVVIVVVVVILATR
ncbi:MAG: serine/threonine protein kinase, partial [Acidimicrobiales bacterium]